MYKLNSNVLGFFNVCEQFMCTVHKSLCIQTNICEGNSLSKSPLCEQFIFK